VHIIGFNMHPPGRAVVSSLIMHTPSVSINTHHIPFHRRVVTDQTNVNLTHTSSVAMYKQRMYSLSVQIVMVFIVQDHSYT